MRNRESKPEDFLDWRKIRNAKQLEQFLLKKSTPVEQPSQSPKLDPDYNDDWECQPDKYSDMQ
jgi:hypothetical protein